MGEIKKKKKIPKPGSHHRLANSESGAGVHTRSLCELRNPELTQPCHGPLQSLKSLGRGEGARALDPRAGGQKGSPPGLGGELGDVAGWGGARRWGEGGLRGAQVRGQRYGRHQDRSLFCLDECVRSMGAPSNIPCAPATSGPAVLFLVGSAVDRALDLDSGSPAINIHAASGNLCS